MASLNKVFLIGRLTRDPELRYTPGGSAVTDLGLAVNRSFTGRDGETKEETLFIDVTVWNRAAETCCQYLKKGRQVHVEGYLRVDSWDDRATGEKRSKVKVEALQVQFIDGRRDEAGGDDYQSAPASPREPRKAAGEVRDGYSNGPARPAAPPASPAPRRPEPSPGPDIEETEEGEDIPF